MEKEGKEVPWKALCKRSASSSAPSPNPRQSQGRERPKEASQPVYVKSSKSPGVQSITKVAGLATAMVTIQQESDEAKVSQDILKAETQNSSAQGTTSVKITYKPCNKPSEHRQNKASVKITRKLAETAIKPQPLPVKAPVLAETNPSISKVGNTEKESGSTDVDQAEMSTPIRKALIDIIMSRQDEKERTVRANIF